MNPHNTSEVVPSIPHSRSNHLYLYSDLHGCLVWAHNTNEVRKLVPGNPQKFVRVAHAGIEPPKGYHKPHGHLAFDPIERIPTMKDLINALSP